MSPEESGGETVKRPHLDRLRSDEGRHPAPHLVGGLVREGERDDPLRRDARRDEVRDAVRHHASLATARPCQHQERPLDVRGRPPLGVVECLE